MHTELKKAKSRADYEARAADILENHAGPAMEGLLDVVADLGDEVEGLDDFATDVRYALELSYRIDKQLVFTGIAELLDGPIAFLIALGAVGIFRAETNRAAASDGKLKKDRALRERVHARLVKAEKADRTMRTRQLRRRLAKIERRIAIANADDTDDDTEE